MMQILVRAPDRLKKDLQYQVQQMGLTLNGLILQILWEWVKREENQHGKAGKGADNSPPACGTERSAHKGGGQKRIKL